MVPRTSRGHSFAGASKYYFLDKQAETNERVEWIETHNIPTEDPDKAIKWMQYTAMNANKIKQEAGVPLTGRKSTKGATYTYSLSWHESETPEQSHMKSCLLETLELLGLNDHEAIFVAHNDTAHPHAHAIVNLVSPIDGRMNTVYNDQKVLSKWAQEYEQKHGVFCEQRIENNKKRALEQDNEKKQTYRNEKLKRAQIVHDLYMKSKDAMDFKEAMKDQGFDLTTGKRRALSFVDEQGKIHSLSRHINLFIDKEENPKWRSEMKARMAYVELQEASLIADQKKQEWLEKQHFDRDKYHENWRRKLEDASIENAQKNDDEVKKMKIKELERVRHEVNRLYRLSDNSRSFKAALESEGFNLAKDDESNLVIVSKNRIYSVKDVADSVDGNELSYRLRDLDLSNIPYSNDLNQDNSQTTKKASDAERLNNENYNKHYTNLAQIMISKVVSEKVLEYGQKQVDELEKIKSNQIKEEKLREKQLRLKEINAKLENTKGFFKRSLIQKLTAEKYDLEASIELTKDKIRTCVSENKAQQEKTRNEYKESLLQSYSVEEKANELKRLADEERANNKLIQERDNRKTKPEIDMDYDEPELY